MMTIKEKILQWAMECNLLFAGKPVTQMMKLQEKMGELAYAIARKDKEKQRVAIGQATMVMIVLAELCGVNIEEEVEKAYNDIKSRHGRVIDGIFVREEHLKRDEK